MEQKPTTIKEIAKRLNVSVSTVSRALHNHSSIGLRTKTQVQQLAAELNYEPNQAAISFKQGKTMTLGVILPNLQEEFFSLAINGIEDMASRNNYTVLIGQSRDSTDREGLIVDTMRRHRVEGLVVSLAKTTKNFDHFIQLEKYNIPVVFLTGCRIGRTCTRYPVTFKTVPRNLWIGWWGRGTVKSGLLKGRIPCFLTRERMLGYQQGLKKHGIKPESAFVVATDLSPAKTADAIHKLMALRNRPTAVIAFNDYVALDAIKYAKGLGLKINKDIAFVSFANLPVTSYLDHPPAASVEQFPYQQAEKATEILLQLISKQEPMPQQHHVVMEGRLVIHKG